jgi:type IV pilus assembly protein PilM
MARKLSSVVGIDIGSKSIKIAELKSQGRDIVITALGMVDTPEGAVDHTGIYNSEAVATALKTALQQSGVAVPSAVASIAGQASVLVRTLEVPKMNPQELREHMQWEINRNIPFSESNVVSDFKVLGGEDPNGQNMDVVMAISPQSAIDTLMSCVKKAGKQLQAIDVEPLGLARSVQTSYGEDYNGKTLCLIDVGHKTTSINIYKDGKLLMPRQVPIGGETFTKAISDALGISAEEAEERKQHIELDSMGALPGSETQQFQPYNPFAEEPEAPPPADLPAAPVPLGTSTGGGDADASRALGDVLSEFAAEIRRSIEYFRSRGGDVDRMAVCGGGSKLRGMSELLAKTVGLECDIYDPLHRLHINAKKTPQAFIDEHRQEFAVAVGNGLHIFYE